MDPRAQAVSHAELLAHADWLRRLAARLVRDPERADDLAQETWRRALEQPPRARGNLRGWLAVAARHVALQTGRSERARVSRELQTSRMPTEPSAADVVEQASLQRDLVARVLELEEPYRSTLLLRYFRDLSPREIAAELGIPRNTVRSHLARGLTRLRERLDADAGGRESWMRALAPLATSSGLCAWTWAPVLTCVAAAVGALVLAVHHAGTPAPLVPATRLAASPASAFAPTEVVEAPALVRPSTEVRRALAGPAAPVPLKGGVLDLRFVDAETGAALSVLEFCVFKERDGNKLFHRGFTDLRGAATVEHLPENVILVQSARRPPHAIGFAAVWLRKDERRALEVRVGRGGRITGRAVDELGTPILGFDVTLPGGPCAYRGLPEPSQPGERVGRTDADGRFVVEAIGELARSVWIVEGEARPETWLPQRVTLESPRFPRWPLASAAGVVRAGEDLDFGDLVVPRSVVYQGVVLDGERQPVVSALVSLDPQRIATSADWRNRGQASQALPGTPDFELEGAEALTAADGTFRLEVPWREQPRQFLVWTVAGRRDPRAAPRLAPGEVRGGIELTISAERVLALELCGPDGAPLDCMPSPPGLQLRGQYGVLPNLGAARVLVASRTDELIDLWPFLDADGLLRLSTDLRAGDVRAVDVFAPGYRPEHVDLPGGFPAGPLVLALRPQARVRVRLELLRSEAKTLDEPLQVRVGACRAGVERIGIAERWFRCCGFGCFATVPLEGAPVDLDLPVVNDEPYWLTVYASAGREHVPGRVLGPFMPDLVAGERHPVLVDPGELRPYEPDGARAAREERAPPARAAPSTARASDQADLLRDLGYVESSEESPLQPGFVARLLEADGTPVAAGTDVVLFGTGQELEACEGRVEGGGFVRLEGELPTRFVLVVNSELGGLYGSSPGDRAFQLLEVDRWSPGVEQSLRLAPWRAVEVVVRGLRDEETALLASLRVSPPEDVLPRLAGRGLGRDLREIAPSEPRTRRFRLELAPGAWTLGGDVGLLAVPPTTIEVRDTEGIQHFVVTVLRP